MSAVIETGEKRLRVFCPAHRVSFEGLGSGRIVCELGPHLLAEQFPHSEVWEYCCDCRSCWPSALGQGVSAAERCAVCARPTARRFICAACKLVSLDSDEATRRKPYTIGGGGIRPACPGCDAVPDKPLLEHYCEVAKASFVTARADCPLCGDAVVELPPFPAVLAEYLHRVDAAHIATVPVRYDARKKALVPSPKGEFLMLKTSGSKLSIALPRANRFDSAEDFNKHYAKCYACDDLIAGEVVINYPATFVRVEGLWTLKDVGHLEVIGDAAAPPVDEVETPEEPACAECGRPTRPGEALCESCVEPPPPASASGVAAADSWTVAGGEPSGVFEREEMPDAGDGRRGGARSHAGKVFAAAALAVLAASVFVVFRVTGSSAEGRLRAAIARGDLVRPRGNSAQDLYRQLKQGGASGSSLAALEKQLLPKLTLAGQQIIDTFMTPGTPDPGLAQWEAAQEMFEWAGEMSPGDTPVAARAAYCRGRISYLGGDKKGALVIWKSAAEQDGSWALPPNGMGLIYNELGEYQKARTHLFEAVRRDPAWAVPYNNIGTSFHRVRDYVQAADYYRRAAERAPNWARPHAWLGDIAMRQQDYATAAREFELVLSSSATGTSEMNLDKIRQELARARQY